MKPIPILLCIALAACQIAANAAAKHPSKAKAKAAAPPAKAPAMQAAETWLALVDTAQYDKSWQAAAPAFQAQVTSAQWTQAMQQVRGPVGAIKTRTFASVKYTKTLPGAPDGDYAVIQYSTAFANQSSVETIILVKAADGQWRTDGYFIR